jgi:ribA/ribD-fused uncharacterized protein
MSPLCQAAVFKPQASRIWDPSSCAVFRKTRELHGGLSNMAGGFAIPMNGMVLRTSEALYQACRFPAHPDVQADIVAERSPMAAKFVAKRHVNLTREDWMEVRVAIMQWAVRIKLAANFEAFGAVLQATCGMTIVEYSSKDPFWGALPQPDGTLVGHNMLGGILDGVFHDLVHRPEVFDGVAPPAGVGGMLLGGLPIGVFHKAAVSRSVA